MNKHLRGVFEDPEQMSTLLGYAQRLAAQSNGRVEAEDLVSEAALKCCAVAVDRRIEKPLHFVMRVMTRAFLDIVGRPLPASLAEIEWAPAAETTDPRESAEQRRHYCRACASLDPADRDVIELWQHLYLQNEPLTEGKRAEAVNEMLARVLGVPPGTARSRLHRAKERLQLRSLLLDTQPEAGAPDLAGAIIMEKALSGEITASELADAMEDCPPPYPLVSRLNDAVVMLETIHALFRKARPRDVELVRLVLADEPECDRFVELLACKYGSPRPAANSGLARKGPYAGRAAGEIAGLLRRVHEILITNNDRLVASAGKGPE